MALEELMKGVCVKAGTQNGELFCNKIIKIYIQWGNNSMLCVTPRLEPFQNYYINYLFVLFIILL